MNMRYAYPVFFFAAFGAIAAPAIAANEDRLVIPSLAPHTPQRAVIARQTVRIAEARRQASGRSQYGGGFIELLMTGQNPAPAPRAVIYNRPPVDPFLSARPVQAAPQMRGQSSTYAALPAPDMSLQRGVDPKYQRQEVEFNGAQAPGTILVDTPNRFLYLVTGSGRAVRYGIGVGRPGFSWSGVKTVSRKAEWPDWRPPSEMLKRRPDLPTFMPGGPDNPLGARALYLGSSLYRIHGTNEPYTIGQNVSSGCIRMMNDDVIDLYRRVKVGTKVVVR